MNPACFKKRVLCVEDHRDTCELITCVLARYEVIGAYSLVEGLRRAADECFDLHLSNYHLPDGTGLELCGLIRAFDRETPILLCSANGDLHKRQALAAGAQGLIKKDERFVETLERHVSRLLSPEEGA